MKSVSLYGDCLRHIFIELPCMDPKLGDAMFAGRFQKAMYGIRDTPQIWAKEVQKVMGGLGFDVSIVLYRSGPRNIARTWTKRFRRLFWSASTLERSSTRMRARRARRAIVPKNYMSQGRLSVAVRVMSQYMSKHRKKIVPVIKWDTVPSMPSFRVEQCHREV